MGLGGKIIFFFTIKMSDSENESENESVDSQESEVGPSPNMMVPPGPDPLDLQSDEGKYTFFIRVTPESEMMQELFEFFKTISNKFVLCKEYSKRKVMHYHAVVFNVLSCKEEIRKKLQEKWSWLKGTKRYNLQDCNDPNNAVVYTLKGDSFSFYGIDPELLKKKRLSLLRSIVRVSLQRL